jgi:hypothetical protein
MLARFARSHSPTPLSAAWPRHASRASVCVTRAHTLQSPAVNRHYHAMCSPSCWLAESFACAPRRPSASLALARYVGGLARPHSRSGGCIRRVLLLAPAFLLAAATGGLSSPAAGWWAQAIRRAARPRLGVRLPSPDNSAVRPSAHRVTGAHVTGKLIAFLRLEHREFNPTTEAQQQHNNAGRAGRHLARCNGVLTASTGPAYDVRKST